MKFAREFKAALQSGDYPEEWCKAAIPYPTLKKCLNKIRAELHGLGLDVDSLRQLLAAQAVSPQGDQIPLARYNLDLTESDVKPHFTIFVDLEDGVVVDASLSSTLRAFLEKQMNIRRGSVQTLDSDDVPMTDAPAPAPTATATLPEGHDSSSSSSSPSSGESAGSPLTGEGSTQTSAQTTPQTTPQSSPPIHAKRMQRVEVSLATDSEFFQLIYQDMAQLERIGEEEQAAIMADVVALGKEVAQLARPERRRPLLQLGKGHGQGGGHHGGKTKVDKYASDLSRWRELFELYLDAQVFFSTRERDHGKARSAVQASRQLDWFQAEVRRRGLLQSFQMPASVEAYQRFLLLNKRLYLNLRFRELNQTARTKILKKFDKWTALGVSQTFPDALMRRRHDVLVEGMAKDVCARIAEDVVAVVPRVEDYTCPVCLSLAWLPVRLRCRHVFCVRCVIKMQRDEQRFCPMCRGEVVMQADLDNLDDELEKFLKLYFRDEVKEKQKANELERGIELFGEDYKPSPCAVM